MEKVIIFDTTLRDGEQSPGYSMNITEKLRVARQLEKLGADVIEAGFPVASEGDFQAVREIARTIRKCQVAGLARAGDMDIDIAWEAIKEAENPRIHTFISTSDIHLKYQLRKTREEVLEMAIRAVKRAKGYTPNVEFSAMDATRSDREYLATVIEAAIHAGATTVNIPDTVGYAIPSEFGKLIKYLKEKVKNSDRAVFSVHCHNDLGLAVANSLAAVLNGARQVECTINGIGERAGNASMEEIVMILRTRKDSLNLDTGVVSEMIYPSSRLLTMITGVAVQPNKAIVGANAFAHESGIHQDGVLKEKITYEIMTPQSIGMTKSTLVMGKHSGRHAFRDRLKELGYDLSEKDLNQAFKHFKELADKKKEIYDEDIEAIVAEVVLRAPDKYKLLHVNVVSGDVAIPTATLQMEIDGEVVKDVGHGDGPVDAVFKTVAKITGTRSRLVKYSVNSITGGTDAQGEVTVRLEEDGNVVVGQGAHTDIIMASVLAYINALNRLDYIKKNPIKKVTDMGNT
ncbi:MAG TPA: 2-isopropylmalate synthase [Thermodesulfobacteriota bacterium]|nr:2-isopropylmalate synthase [Thermodesulfobacteriota bacterium]